MTSVVGDVRSLVMLCQCATQSCCCRGACSCVVMPSLVFDALLTDWDWTACALLTTPGCTHATDVGVQCFNTTLTRLVDDGGNTTSGFGMLQVCRCFSVSLFPLFSSRSPVLFSLLNVYHNRARVVARGFKLRALYPLCFTPRSTMMASGARCAVTRTLV